MKGGIKTIIDKDMPLHHNVFSGSNTSKTKEGCHEK
jgi:hypothetical protein